MVSFEEDEIVISGISGHFPETDTLDELVSNLMNGVDMVTEERPRWEPGHLGVPMRTGKMKTLEKCDAQYFGLIAKQCHSLDPITRKVLERTYEAVVDAGLNPANFAGTNTGVFIGVSIVETEMCLMTAKDSNPYNILGRNRTMNANRVSYWLDLKGPSMSVDSSWLSGLQALTFGYEYIKSGICEMAIVAAGSSIIHANFSKHFSNLELLSPDGTSRSFDEAANGWARSEAVVVLLLQKLKHAKRNYGIIVNSMCTCISSIPSRLIVPSKEQWLKVYKEFYENCNVDPEQIAFLEADGMACPEADAAELNAANEFFCRDRDSSRPLLVGSVKTNMGHTMATAGLCSVVKALIANKTGVIPPNLHYNQPNKSILGLLSGTMKVVTEPTPLEGEYIAVSSFGYGGTFGHCVIKRPSVRVPPPAPADSIPTLVLLSGRDEEGVKATLNAVESLPYSPEYIRLIHDVFSKNLANHIYRGYTILPKGDTPLWSVESYQGAKRPVWFVFSGMGSHWATMARDLMRFPIFKQSIDVCHKVLQTKGIDLWDIMTRDDSSIFDNIVHSFVSISSTQVALVDILFSLGIQPDGIVGHSAGELGAAYADGCLTREEMILASYSRGKVSNEVKVINGLMAAVGAGYAEMKDRLPEDVEVACHNSSTSCTISGPTEKIIAVVEKLKQEGMFVRTVNTSNIPYHSKHIRDLGPRLNEELLQVITNPKKRSKKWISSSVPQSKWHEPEWGVCSAEYLTNNLLSPVLFEEACKHIPKNAIIIEIAPHSMLLSVLKRSLSKDCSIIGLTHRNAPDQLVHLLQSIGKLYTIGLQPQVSNLDPKVDFPVSLNTPFLGNLVTWDHSLSWSTNADVEEVSTKMSKVFNLYLDENPHLRGFRYDEKSILPCSVLLNLIVEAFFTMKNMNMSEVGVTLSDVFFTKPIEISKIRNLELEVTKNIGSGEFEILMGDEVVATGFAKESDPKARSDLYFDQVRSPKITMSEDEVYSQLEHLGYQYQGCFRNIKKLSVDNFVWESEVEWKKNLINLIESSIQCHLLASSHPDYLQEVKFIRELTLEPSLLPKTDAEIRLTLDTKTRVMKSAGINVKDLKFKLMEMEPLQLNCEKTLVSTRTGNESKFAYIQYSSKNVTSKQIGYSTKTSSGTNIIGVGTFEDATKSIRPDDILFWQIPEKWSLDEAATMPFPYCLAFYIIEIIADIKKGDSILITNADSNIGLACIAVALQHTTDVWAVVETKESKQLLTKKFQQLKNVAVVERASEMFNSILPRKKSRVDMVINIGWERKIEHCLDCMGFFGHVFQIYIEDVKENDLFAATNNLVRSGSIYGITLQRILAAREDDKTKIKELIAQGIKSGVVAPFSKRALLQKQARDSCENESEVIRLENNGKATPKLESSYLVICDQLCDGLKIAEWLAKRDASSVRVVHSDKRISSSSEAKINLLKPSTHLVVKHLESLDEASLERCIPDVSSFHAAVVLPVDRDDTTDFSGTIARFFSCSESKIHLICVLKPGSRAVDLCTERNRTGLPTSVVLWNRPINGKIRQFTRLLDRILDEIPENVIEVKEEQQSSNIEKDIDEFLRSLPKNAADVARYGENVSNEVKVTEIKTLSLPFKYAKETLPIFLIEGIKSSASTVEMFSNSLYATFLVELPHVGSSSLEELSSYVVPKIKSITEGPFILVGEQWGGCIALEIGRQLERLGYKAHVFLLSGTPAEVIDPLKYIASLGEPLEVSLISRLLQIKDEKVLQELSNLKNWSSKLNYCMQFIKGNRNDVIKGLDAIKWRLEALLNFSQKAPLNGPLTIFTKKKMNAEHYKYLCKTRVIIHEVSEEEHILNSNTFSMIHNMAIHKTF